MIRLLRNVIFELKLTISDFFTENIIRFYLYFWKSYFLFFLVVQWPEIVYFWKFWHKSKNFKNQGDIRGYLRQRNMAVFRLQLHLQASTGVPEEIQYICLQVQLIFVEIPFLSRT